jgi:hypothetical protein
VLERHYFSNDGYVGRTYDVSAAGVPDSEERSDGDGSPLRIADTPISPSRPTVATSTMPPSFSTMTMETNPPPSGAREQEYRRSDELKISNRRTTGPLAYVRSADCTIEPGSHGMVPGANRSSRGE